MVDGRSVYSIAKVVFAILVFFLTFSLVRIFMPLQRNPGPNEPVPERFEDIVKKLNKLNSESKNQGPVSPEAVKNEK